MHVSIRIAHVFMLKQTCFDLIKGFTLCLSCILCAWIVDPWLQAQSSKHPHLEALANLILHANSHAQQQSASLPSCGSRFDFADHFADFLLIGTPCWQWPNRYRKL